ncbi:hypothetical protein [Micromonospora sediminicola]|uniref:hypothetical protein n=1 Tax=Micromonospora sediminicola TaxID=946078 RepID=UPI0037AF3CCD
MRYEFAGGPADYTIMVGDTVTISTPTGPVSGRSAVVVGSQPVTFWTDEQGGTQHTDLLDSQGDPATFVTSSDGTARGLGQIASLTGPDNVVAMWAQAGDGPRVRMTANVAPTALATARNLDQHTADRNGHGTGVADLADVTVPPAAQRVTGDVLGVLAGGQLGLLSPAQASGALLLNPPKTAGVYTGNVAQPPDPSQGQNGNPWLRIQAAASPTDDNPDILQLHSTHSDGSPIKTGWANGNGELRGAPSAKNRIGGRFFEFYETKGGPSTGRFFELSTNPAQAAQREALLGAYGTGNATMPGWIVATRVLAGQKGVQAGGNHNALNPLNFRGRSASVGAPTAGVWVAGDVVMDAAGFFWLCTATGEPGTWVGGPGSGGGGGGTQAAAPTAFVDLTPGTGMAIDTTRRAQVRLERGADAVRLRGTLNATAAVASGAVVATLPAMYRPASTVSVIARSTGGGNRLTVAPNGDIAYSASFTSGQSLWLDALTYDLL